MTESEVVDWLQDEMRGQVTGDEDMGELEKLVDGSTREIRRRLLERLVQETADAVELACEHCGELLRIVAHRRGRSINSSVGTIGLERTYGWCPKCARHLYPADVALGMRAGGRASPRVQEVCALSVLRAPTARAEKDVHRMTGIEVSASTLHREARRQGERALALRDRDVELTQRPGGVDALAARAPELPENSTLIIEIDAWNIRERDCWGRTEQLRRDGEEPSRWHWVYTATVFRLDQRGTDRKGRSIIVERGYVATRGGVEPFTRQLYAEALQRGLQQAETVLVIGDGAAWIWNLAGKQFKGAAQRLDLFHVKEHLWELAGELHGRGTAEAREWVRPYLQCLERRRDGPLDVIDSLQQLSDKLRQLDQDKHEAVKREIGYLDQHKDRMDYKEAKKLGQPCGSGAIESTCSQYQRRFKLTGQFWSLQGDEAFLALATLHRNERWHLLFPHDQS